MKKEEQTRGRSITTDAGKGERHAHKTSQALASGVIPPLHVGRFSGLFAYRRMLVLRDHCLIRRPEVGETMSLTVGGWNGFPQPLARLFTAITQRVSDHLSRLATQGNPHPGVVGLFEHTRAIRSSSSSVVDVASSGLENVQSQANMI